MENEIWKRIVELYKYAYNGGPILSTHTFNKKEYWISSEGRLKNSKGRIATDKNKTNGYIKNGLVDDQGKSLKFRRHLIVIQTFSQDEWEEGLTCDHDNSIRDDNRLINLGWKSMSEQIKKAKSNGFK